MDCADAAVSNVLVCQVRGRRSSVHRQLDLKNPLKDKNKLPLNIPGAFLFLISQAIPSQTDNGDFSSSIITLETKFDTEQSQTYDQARSKELPSIADDSN
ncbi:hypothetical protein ACTXT7_015195 [Hymenolepis weldensis]